LAKERDEERMECTRLYEKNEELWERLEDWHRLYDSFEEAYGPNIKAAQELDAQLDDYAELQRNWNRLVAEHNALADLVDERRLNGTLTKRERGRQIAATPEQRADVFRLHEEGVSLREIAADVGIGFQTVRTLIGKIDGTDRTSRKLFWDRARGKILSTN
jgi:hypothetical protein